MGWWRTGALHWPESFSSLTTLIVQSLVQVTNKILEMSMIKTSPHLVIRVSVKRIQVLPEWTRKDDRILLIKAIINIGLICHLPISLALVHKQIKMSVSKWILKITCPDSWWLNFFVSLACFFFSEQNSLLFIEKFSLYNKCYLSYVNNQLYLWHINICNSFVNTINIMEE